MPQPSHDQHGAYKWVVLSNTTLGMLAAAINLLIIRDESAFARYRFWSIGQLAGRGDALADLWPFAVVGLLLALCCGGALNALTIAANGGQMPASEAAVRAAGLPVDVDRFVNSGVLEDPRLAWLGDVFASPAWLPLRRPRAPGRWRRRPRR